MTTTAMIDHELKKPAQAVGASNKPSEPSMFSYLRNLPVTTLKKGAPLAALTMALAIAPLAPAQTAAPSATASFSGGAVAAGVGYTWGSGVLHFNGRKYPFRVSGLSVNDIGVDHIEGVGEVYNLRKAEDLSGNYVAAGAGATLAGGGLVAALENQNGVIIHFHSTTQGLRLNLSANGVFVRLND